MQEQYISDPVFETAVGWFRYNFEQNCVEFIRNDNKTIAGRWPLPVDQWNALPSQRAYCEQIFAQEQAAASKAAKSRKIFNIGTTIFLVILLILYALSIISFYVGFACIFLLLIVGSILSLTGKW